MPRDLEDAHMNPSTQSPQAPRFRPAGHGDGAALWRLVRSAGTLEVNSAYFYVLFASDFGDTCLIAEINDAMVGAVIGYRPPARPESAFVWQIGVAPEVQGHGLGRQLLREWLSLPANADARWLTATVAEDNIASGRLFRALARDLGATCEDVPYFTEDLFPHRHPAERLFRVGPLDRSSVTQNVTSRVDRPRTRASRT